MFYHIKNLQSTKTGSRVAEQPEWFYHIKNLQSTKTKGLKSSMKLCFITLRIYKVLKLHKHARHGKTVLSH